VKLDEKRRKLAAAASLLEGRNADGLVSDFASAFTFLFSGSALLSITPVSAVIGSQMHLVVNGGEKKE